MALNTLHTDTPLRLSSYPYVNARVRAMRSKLLTPGDYRKLESMSLNEVAAFLQQHAYKDAVDRFGDTLTGAQLLEAALRSDLYATYQKLVRISPEDVATVLDAYFTTYTRENVKTAVRSIHAGEPVTKEDLPYPLHANTDLIAAANNAETLHDLVQTLTLPHGQLLSTALENRDPSLESVEHAIDQYFYTTLLHIADQLPSQGERFKAFLYREAEIRNISFALRCKKHGKTDVETRLLPLPNRHTHVNLEHVTSADSYDAAVQHVKDAKIGGYIDGTSLTAAENGLRRYHLEKAAEMLHRDPLSINPVLGYLIAKQTEVENLQAIVHAKHHDLSPSFLKENLVYNVKHPGENRG